MRRHVLIPVLSTLLPMTACAQSGPEAPHVVDIFKQACLDTGADRQRFEALAQDAGWPRLDISVDPSEGRDWVTGYQATPRLNIVLSGTHARQGPPPGVETSGPDRAHVIPEATRCEAFANPYPADWRARLQALDVDGAPLAEHSRTSTTRELSPPARVEILSWGEPIDGRMIRALHDPSRGLHLAVILINHESLRALDADRL